MTLGSRPLSAFLKTVSDHDLKVGINNEAPEEALDVTGNIQQSGVLKINDTTDATTIGTGSAIIKGGVGIAKNLFVGGNISNPFKQVEVFFSMIILGYFGVQVIYGYFFKLYPFKFGLSP